MRPGAPDVSEHTIRTKRGPILRSTRGQAIVESGIAMIILLACIFAVMDSGMMLYTYLTLENAVSEATRFAVTNQTTGGLSRLESVKSVMRQSCPGVTISDGEFTFQNITDGTADIGGPNDVIRITVQHPYTLVMPLLVYSGAFRITVSATMMNEPDA